MGKVFQEVRKDLPTVAGKLFVITGTTSGTGLVAAQTAAEQGGEVVLLNRSSPRSEAALKKLREAVPEGKFVPIVCDLQDFASVRNAAKEINDKYDKIYCLANNAGITSSPEKATKDGYDVQMQTNHLSHFLLTALLFPKIAAAAKEFGDARIVQHSSLARNSPVALEEKYFGQNVGKLGGDSGNFLSGPMVERYGQTKLANAVFSYSLHDKIASNPAYNGVRAVAAHPGISDTGFTDNGKANFFMKAIFKLVTPFVMQSTEDGATGLVKCMMDPSAESGNLYGPINGVKGKAVVNPPEANEKDPEAKAMLWRASEEATGVQFNI